MAGCPCGPLRVVTCLPIHHLGCVAGVGLPDWGSSSQREDFCWGFTFPGWGASRCVGSGLRYVRGVGAGPMGDKESFVPLSEVHPRVEVLQI